MSSAAVQQRLLSAASFPDNWPLQFVSRGTCSSAYVRTRPKSSTVHDSAESERFHLMEILDESEQQHAGHLYLGACGSTATNLTT